MVSQSPEKTDITSRFQLLRSVGEECISEVELKQLLEEKPKDFVLYDGFEPSGRMHIAQGLMKSINVNKCTQVQCHALPKDGVVGIEIFDHRLHILKPEEFPSV